MKEEENVEGGLLAKEKIENAEEEKLDTQKLEEIDDGDDFKGYTTEAKYKLFGLFFAIGIINHLGTILVMTGGRLLSKELDMDDYLSIYTSASILFALFTRITNSKLCVKISYKKRIYFLCFWMIAGYFLMFLILLLHDTALKKHNILCFILSFIPCFFLGSSYAFGESAMIAYLRLYPKTLIAGWSSGTGVSGIVGGTLNFLSQLNKNFTLKYLYLILIPVGPLYIYLFELTVKIYIVQRKNRAKNSKNSTMELSPMEGETMEDENIEIQGQGEGRQKNEDINKPGENEKQLEEKELEGMNLGNKTMSIENLINVMKSCGEVIGNLGIIYFLQFFCLTCLVKRVCDKVDIGFLPKHGDERKGKYEFISLFFQLGMFISKTFIKIVRKIQPIEVYSIVIAVINILFVIDYRTGFLKWYNYTWICFLLGFFGGGTYAGGFYTILNSNKVPENYKELTVNVATFFNDFGTFLSGIFGLLGLKYWFDVTAPFENQS
jgi:hypothetical protein